MTHCPAPEKSNQPSWTELVGTQLEPKIIKDPITRLKQIDISTLLHMRSQSPLRQSHPQLKHHQRVTSSGNVETIEAEKLTIWRPERHCICRLLMVRLLQKPLTFHYATFFSGWHFDRDLAPNITIKRTSKCNQKNLQKWNLDQLEKNSSSFLIAWVKRLITWAKHGSQGRAWFKATVAYFQSCRFPKAPSKRVKSCQLGFPIQSMSYP